MGCGCMRGGFGSGRGTRNYDRQMIRARCDGTLMRGSHELPHQSQAVRRDLDGEQILRDRGKEAFSYALTEEQYQDRVSGRDPNMPYRFLVRSAESAALSWTAFRTKQGLHAFVRAYGLRLAGSTEPGSTFRVQIPDRPRMQPLRCMKGR